MNDFKDYTIFIRNFDSKQVTQDLLLELFTQAGPVQNLKIKDDFAFIEFEDKESVIYACNLLNETELFGIPLEVKPRNGSCFENVELYKFPIKRGYNDTDNRSINTNYNEYRQNSRSSNNSFNEPDFRQNHRSSFHETDFSLNNRSNNYYEDDYRQNVRSTQMNNFNEMSNRSNNRHSYNNQNYTNSDYNWQNGNRFSLNNNLSQDNRSVDNQSYYNNFEYRQQRSNVETPSQQNRGFNMSHDRRQLSTESLWRDRGANAGWADAGSGPALNKSYGNYRNRPY